MTQTSPRSRFPRSDSDVRRNGRFIQVRSCDRRADNKITNESNTRLQPQHLVVNFNSDKHVEKLQGAGLLGNEARNQVYGPGTQALALSTFKSFPIHEAIELQFRAEAFNLLNTATFGTPNTTITSYSLGGVGVPDVSAGQIGSTAASATPRQIQFALKLLL